MAEAPKNDDVSALLKKIPLSSLPMSPKGQIEFLRSDMNLQEAVVFLHERGILGAPVVNVAAPPNASWREKYLGMIDMPMALNYILQALESKVEIPEGDEEVEVSHKMHFDAPTDLNKTTLDKLTGDHPFFFPFLPLEVHATLYDAVLLLGSFRVKRIPIIDKPEGDIINIVTQSSVVHLLSVGLESFPSVTHTTLAASGLGEPHTLFSIRMDQPVQAAFEIMRKNEVSGVPVLGVGGMMVGHISARHVFYILTSTNQNRVLRMHAAQFLALVENKSLKFDIKNTAITCLPSDTIGHVMQKMDAARIHRIYVQDQSGHLLRTVSLCDILEKFVKAPETCSIL